MKRAFFPRACAWMVSLGFLFSAGPACLAAEDGSSPAERDAEQPTFRDLARKYFQDGNGADLARLVGYSQPVKKVIALEYKVLLATHDEQRKLVEKPVDPKTYEFKIGDRIRITVEPFEDYYVYIFHVGASGQSSFLLPSDDEQAPLVKREQPIRLPDDGYFEFEAPAGEETLMVVATEKPVADRNVLAGVLTKRPGEADTPEQREVRKTLKATVKKALKSVQERQKELLHKNVVWRGLLTDEAARKLAEDVKSRGVRQGTFEEPHPHTTGGTAAMYVSVVAEEGSKLLVNIPLRSVEK